MVDDYFGTKVPVPFARLQDLERRVGIEPDKRIAQSADVLAFLAHELGAEPPGA